jgi:hypothetical protein
MSKMVRLKVLLLLTLAFVYGGMTTPGNAIQSCSNRLCNDLPEFCSPGLGCSFIQYTYLGICDAGFGETGHLYQVRCASCVTPGWGYCHYQIE